jgi:hypothetical protein
MNDAVFIVAKTSGELMIGDKEEIDKVQWKKPHGLRLTSSSRYIRDKLLPRLS